MKQSQDLKRIKEIMFCVLLLAIGIVWAFPFLWMLNTSFSTEGNVFSISPQLGDLLFTRYAFSNYVTVLSEYNFLLYAINTFIVTFSASIGQLITCSLAGFAFARMKFRGKEILFGLLLSTMMIPIQVVIIPEFLLIMRLHWLDTWAPLIVPSFLVGGLGTFLLRSFFENIPQELEDVAVIDGSGPFRLYWSIFLPLAKVPLVTLFMLAFIINWNQLLRPIIYLSSSKLMTLPMALTTFQSQYEAQWHLLLTGSVLTIFPLLLIYIFLQKYIIPGMTGIAVKG